MDLEKLFRSTKRGLFIVLTLSCIGSAFSLLGNLIMGLAYPVYEAMYESGDLMDMLMRLGGDQDSELYEAALEQSMSVPRVVYLLHTLLYALSLAGVIMMYRLRKNGAHLYAIAQLLVIIVTVLFLGKGHTNVGNIMMTIVFAAYYLLTFRRLDQIKEAQETEKTAEDKPLVNSEKE